MSRLKVEPSDVKGKVRAQPSKSYTHRLLSIALLAEGISEISDPLLSLDTRATLDAVRFFGGKIKKINRGWKISGTGGELDPSDRVINVRNSGTTLRLMSAISSLSPKKVRLTGDESILKRPMGPLVDSLIDLGVEARCEGSRGRPPVVVGGGLEGGETRISGAISSQFISALLIASPYSEVGVDLEVEEELISKPYVRITLKTLELANFDIKTDPSLMSYKIPGGQVFDSIKCRVPGDFSSASFLLGAGAFSSKGVKVSNLDPRGIQGDKRIIDLLKDFGADVEVQGKEVKVRKDGRLKGIEADCSDNPDLVPILAILAATAEGQTRLHNISHLQYKEVNRLKALTSELKKLGVQVKELEDGLKIFGTEQLKGGKLNSYGDHRIAMSLAIAGLVARGPVEIKGAQCISVSYPSFVEDMKKLGAEMETVE